MTKMRNLGAPIAESKIRGLREMLDRDGEVVFRNGSVVKRETTEIVTQLTGEVQSVVHLIVTRPAGGIARFAESEIRSAYAMALRGPEPRKEPTGDPTMFGDDPPW